MEDHEVYYHDFFQIFRLTFIASALPLKF